LGTRRWRCHAFTPRLLLRRSHRTFSLRSTSRTLAARLLLALRVSYTALRLFDRARLLYRSWLFRSLCCLRRRRVVSTLTLALVSHLELLSLRAIGRRIHAHRLC
jgi:hypothetical protein